MTSYLPPIPPVVPPNAELGAEWVKRYMSDQSQFRDVLRKWIVSANLCCDTNTSAVADHETRIDALEAGGVGGAAWDFDEGDSATVYSVGTIDFDEGASV